MRGGLVGQSRDGKWGFGRNCRDACSCVFIASFRSFGGRLRSMIATISLGIAHLASYPRR